MFYFIYTCRRPENWEIYDIPSSPTKGVAFKALANRNYGPLYGIYIANGPKETARNMCFSGSTRVGNVMKTDVSGTLGTFECS